ncbi:hypothetical protein COY07_03395 [Candidatus Peregrinibacteria bacterium CG_4_10_14_0_2_um_filter_43_11]|nr:MAG: hypothetical protein COY07_03395 [Candidatus Peregrinibacteria bacterium CG_4_10_14_0_2_um_filter_43_11]
MTHSARPKVLDLTEGVRSYREREGLLELMEFEGRQYKVYPPKSVLVHHTRALTEAAIGESITDTLQGTEGGLMTAVGGTFVNRYRSVAGEALKGRLVGNVDEVWAGDRGIRPGHPLFAKWM